MEFSWASDYPDIQKLCQQFSMTELENPVRFRYKPLPSIIQDGPTCGLVALAMCCDDLNNKLMEDISQEAVRRAYTNNGEMFSATNMNKLAKLFLRNEVGLYTGSLLDERIINFLLSGGTILVPYDSDRDHSPCNKNGHKAHWAAISGIIQTKEDVFVVAKQGKSTRPMVWKLLALSESNDQLCEVCPERQKSEVEYIVPPGGIDGPFGLKNRCILVHPSS